MQRPGLEAPLILGLNESPSEKEGKSPGIMRQASACPLPQ